MWLLRCGIFAPTRWKPCSYCVASFCGSTGTPKSPLAKTKTRPNAAVLLNGATVWAFWRNPRKGWDAVAKEFADTPDVIRQAGSHRWGTGRADMLGFAQLVMHQTEIVGASDQIHAGLKGSETTGGMTRFARQAGQSLPEGAIQALDKSGVEDHRPS